MRALLVATLVLVMASMTACSDSADTGNLGGSGEIENAGYVGTDLTDDELLDGGHREKYSREGLENISFWDYSRAISILGWGYAVGYITIDEYLFQSIPIGWMVQKDYDSWETASKAYLEGYKHWRDLPADTNDIEYMMREAAYEMLLENPDSIYNTADFIYDLKMKREE